MNMYVTHEGTHGERHIESGQNRSEKERVKWGSVLCPLRLRDD